MAVCPPGLPSIGVVSQHIHLSAISAFPCEHPLATKKLHRVTSVLRIRQFLRAVTVTVGLFHGLKTTVTTKENGNCHREEVCIDAAVCSS